MADEAAGLDRLLHPRSIAVIGASRDPAKWGYWVVANTRGEGFEGRLYGVNPTPGPSPVAGVEMVGAVAEIPGPIDLAVAALPRRKLRKAVIECARRGVGALVVITAGLGEKGAEGRRVERDLGALAQTAGMRILGPNCFGLFSAAARVNLTSRPDVPRGAIAVASQSGNVAIELSEMARRERLGWSTLIGIGNQLDVDFGDVLRFCAGDPHTEAAMLYVEGIPGSGAMKLVHGLDACRARGKPVIVLKGGATSAGGRTAATHTGTLAADDRVWDAVLRDHGAVRVRSTEEAVDTVRCALRIPRGRGRVMVMTDGGGCSVLACDEVARAGLSLARLRPATRSRLAAMVPPMAPNPPAMNPITLDTPGGLESDPRLLPDCVEAVCRDPGVDAILVAGVFGGYRHLQARQREAAERIVRLSAAGSPIVLQTAFARSGDESIEILRRGGVPVYPVIDRMVEALGRWTAPAPRAAARGRRARPRRDGEGGRPLGHARVVEMLTGAGIALPPMREVAGGEDLAAAARDMGFPVCLKLSDAAHTHKSEVGGVALGLGSIDAVREAAAAMWSRFPTSRLLLMPSFPGGLEMLVGCMPDPTFGPVVVVGRGGIWTEVEDDAVLLPAPVTRARARAALSQLRCFPVLAGARGQPALARDGLARLVAAVSRLAARRPELTLDLNPVLVHRDRCRIVDVRAFVA